MENKNHFIELLKVRKSIREFSEREVEKEKIEIIKEAMLLSPSSRNIKPWEFYFSTSPDIARELSLSKKSGSEFLKGARLCIVICGDPEKSDVWVEDCSIASIIAQLTAESIGLGSCWVQIRNRMHDDKTSAENFVKMVLGLPDRLKVESIIGVGYAG
ncbi:NAD(P)H-dependent dehydrogenase/reductase [candidate division KSB1 bacterium]|nr:MAG: NAD(P)H-dependent dehydrogenase/reductase [candidate division KSB1 bacterium]